MRIAWIGKKSPGCGNVTYCREITNGLIHRNHQVTFLHFASGPGKAEQLENPFICERSRTSDRILKPQLPATIGLPHIYKSVSYTIPSWRANHLLVDTLIRFKFDLIHASLVLSPLDFYLPVISRRLKLPLLATFHQPFDSQYRSATSLSQQLTYWLYASALSHYHHVIVFSQLQMMLLEQLGVPGDRIAIIPNSVDADKYSPGPSPIKQELQAQFLFVYQGRLVAEKNVEALLQAWEQTPMPAGYKLVMVGTGPLAARLQARYSHHPSIVWMGYIEDEQRRIEILRGSDVFILPSLVEGLSLALLEAMACGVACVATDTGAHSEVLAGGCGILLDINQVKHQLCQVLPTFIHQPQLAQMLGDKARQQILKHYTLNTNLDRLESLYNQVLQQPLR